MEIEGKCVRALSRRVTSAFSGWDARQEPQHGLEPFDLFLQFVADRPLQESGDVGVQIRVLLPKRGNGYRERRLKLLEVGHRFRKLGAGLLVPGRQVVDRHRHLFHGFPSDEGLEASAGRSRATRMHTLRHNHTSINIFMRAVW